jgi:hypothetical protein
VQRRGAVFGRSHGSITLSEDGSVAIKAVGNYTIRTAASKVVMRAGRHYAQFTVMSVGDMFVGVIRPGWNVEGGQIASDVTVADVHGHCFYDTFDGHCLPRDDTWEGMQGAREGDRIGMLLDLDQGSMTVYRNDERLGVMATGLTGEYSWAVTLESEDDSARIDAAPAPASPTTEELAQAVAYAAEQGGEDY